MVELPLCNNLKGKQNLFDEKNRKTKISDLKVNQEGEKSLILI